MLEIERKIILFYKEQREFKEVELSKFNDGEWLKNIYLPLAGLPTNNFLPNGKYCSEMTELFDDRLFNLKRIVKY